MRGSSEYGAREVLHHTVQRRKVLVLKYQGLRETSPVGMSGDPFYTVGDAVVMCNFTTM
jgi:hypothetical protein